MNEETKDIGPGCPVCGGQPEDFPGSDAKPCCNPACRGKWGTGCYHCHDPRFYTPTRPDGETERPDVERWLENAERVLAGLPDGWIDLWPEALRDACLWILHLELASEKEARTQALSQVERDRDDAREIAENLHEVLDNLLSGNITDDVVEIDASLPWLASATTPRDPQPDRLELARSELSECTGGRPDFAGFLTSLKSEARGTQEIHAGDRSGQATSDVDKLEKLAEQVERVGKSLGFL